MESQTGAGLIAGMLQGTKHINPVWDTLPESTVDEFLRAWTRELDNWNVGSTDAIIASISHHDALRDAWCLLDERSREARRQVIQTIAANLRNQETRHQE
jgi:3-methyladenine DNA glycosylase AlkD